MSKAKFYFTTKAMVVATLVVISISIASCSSSRKIGLKAIKLFVNYPVLISKGDAIQFFNLQDTVTIFYYEDYILYRLGAFKDLATDERIAGSEPWFLHKKNANLGVLFNSLKDSLKRAELPVDSFLNSRAYKNASFGIPSDSAYGKVSDPVINLERYFVRTDPGALSPDSIYYYFSKDLKDFEYTLSPKLDSAKKMKLYKARLLYNEKYHAPSQANLPKREFLFEIREEKTGNSKEIIAFIKKMKPVVANLKK